MEKRNQPEIKTERLVLRSFKQKDAKQVQKLAGNHNVSKTTLNIPHPYENGMAEEWIKAHSENWRSKSRVTYAITDNNTEQLIGAVGLVEIEGTQGELGFWIGETHWGNGYCTEATKAIINFAFTQLGLEKIVAEHLSLNPASGRVMKKAGMLHVGTKKRADRYSEPADVEIYEMQNT